MDMDTLVSLIPFIFLTVVAVIGSAFFMIYYFYDKKRHPEAY